MLELVGAWFCLCGNQALLCFIKVSEVILMSLVKWRALILCSAFRKLLHLQTKVAPLLYSSMLDICWKGLSQEVILYLVI